MRARAVLRGGARHTQQPYHVCGGLQDNGSWCGAEPHVLPAGHRQRGLGAASAAATASTPWSTRPTPTSSTSRARTATCSGSTCATNERRMIRPEPPTPASATASTGTRPSSSRRTIRRPIYYGGNRLFGSKDRGDTWTLVTPDLTNADARSATAMPIFGKTAKEHAVAQRRRRPLAARSRPSPSRPLKPGVLWVGTDDGNLQVSRDGGATWTSVAAARARRAEGHLREPHRDEPRAAKAPPTWPSTAIARTTSRPTSCAPTTSARPGGRVASNLPAGRHRQRRARAPDEPGRALRRHRARALGQPRPRRALAARQGQAAHGARRRRPDPSARPGPDRGHARPRRLHPRRRGVRC